MAPFDELPYSDCEVLQYKMVEAPQIVYHPPVIDKPLRDGAEEEKALRGIMGPITPILNSFDSTKLKGVFLKPPDVDSY